MSTKTMKQRIAVVAVSALTAGVLSVASAPVANSAVAAGNVLVTAKTDLVNAGACAIVATAGKIGGTFVNGSTVSLTNSVAGDTAYLSISGPAIWVSAAVSAGTTADATITPTTLTDATTAANDVYKLLLTGLGTVTVTYAATSSAAATDAITITSVASCLTSTLSLANSNFTITSSAETDTDLAGDVDGAWLTRFDGVDTTDANIVAVSSTGYARAVLANAYDAPLSAKPVIATATGTGTGCWVAISATDTTAGGGTPAASTAVMTSAGHASNLDDITLSVKTATAGEAVNCTVTLSWNGITVGSKSFKLQGVAAKVVVSDVTVGVKGGSGYYRAAVTDSLGNALPSLTISNSATETNNAASATIVSDSASVAATTGTSTVASTGAVTGKTPAVTSDNLTAGTVASYTCTDKGGAAKVTVRALASGVTYITSAPFDVYCGAASVDTWSISMDKASYAPGEIATLTVSAKDADGHVAQSLLTLGASEYSFGGMTFVTAPTTADKFNSAAGAKTYKLSVGTTEGSFVGTFKITGTTDTSAKTIQYAVKSSTASVSNADVLKSIVALIASINKQIQALQKLILKR